MRTYYADRELNEKYFPIFEDMVEKQECYDNTFHNVHQMNYHEKDLKIFIGFVPFILGTATNLLIIPIAGKLPIQNLVSIIICAVIGLVGGLVIYNSNKKLINNSTE